MSTEQVIDVGYSRIKWGRVQAGCLDIGSVQCSPVQQWRQPAASAPARALILSSSGNAFAGRLAEHLRRSGTQTNVISTGDRKLPVAAAYASLGCDRWLALQKPAGAEPGPFVVVDAGTAITVDVVDGNNSHLGGWIMPGLISAQAGLLARAPGLDRRLPESDYTHQPARNTEQALAQGALMLAAGGIERAVEAARKNIGPRPALWLTGGDATRLAACLPQSFRLDPHLVLHGMALATQVK
ncbi:MAG TPA: type III pantothenate kinase [Wenzhouxiangella sp.]|nr:type III pantothenate kinase [Wenzhouxiangella sp.]HLS04986.1 type III pantothenate kinase [Wenzhouxiangella sp.]